MWFVSLFMWMLWLLNALTRKICQFEFYDVVCRTAVVSHINISQEEFIATLTQEVILSNGLLLDLVVRVSMKGRKCQENENTKMFLLWSSTRLLCKIHPFSSAHCLKSEQPCTLSCLEILNLGPVSYFSFPSYLYYRL